VAKRVVVEESTADTDKYAGVSVSAIKKELATLDGKLAAAADLDAMDSPKAIAWQAERDEYQGSLDKRDAKKAERKREAERREARGKHFDGMRAAMSDALQTVFTSRKVTEGEFGRLEGKGRWSFAQNESGDLEVLLTWTKEGGVTTRQGKGRTADYRKVDGKLAEVLGVEAGSYSKAELVQIPALIEAGRIKSYNQNSGQIINPFIRDYNKVADADADTDALPMWDELPAAESPDANES
jgi:hypothetical protein